MQIVLNLADDGRIQGAGVYAVIPEGAIVVDSIPEGNLADYLYIDGQFVHDPLPVVEEPENLPSDAERIAELEEALALLLSGVTE